MTPESIKCPTCGTPLLEHPANRCLDAWVAEKVFGYEWRELDDDIALCEPEESSHNSSYFRTYWPNRSHGFYDRDLDVLPYSSDISAAWEVKDEMRRRGYWMYLRSLSSYCGCKFAGEKTVDATAVYDEESLAICRASLLAVLG